MSYTICVGNNKGGVGKTTTAVNLARGLGRMGYKTLAVDMDGQANLTTTICGYGEFPDSMADVMVSDETPISSILIQTEFADILPANKNLNSIQYKLLTDVSLGQQMRLKRKLETLKSDYDYIIIDTAPNLEMGTVNAMVAADGVVLTVIPANYERQGTQSVMDAVSSVQQYFSGETEFLGVLFTMVRRTRLHAQVQREIQNTLGGKVFDTSIPFTTSITESSIPGLDLYSAYRKTTGSLAYAKFCEEVVQRV